MKDLRCTCLKVEFQTKNFQQMEAKREGYEEMCSLWNGESLEERWEKTHSFYQAGMPDGIIALGFSLSFEENGTPKEMICDLINNIFLGILKKENKMLYLGYKGDSGRHHLFVMIYPMQFRTLETGSYLKRDNVNPSFYSTLISLYEDMRGIPYEEATEEPEIEEEIEVIVSASEEEKPKEEASLTNQEERVEHKYSSPPARREVICSLSEKEKIEIINSTLEYFTLGSDRSLFQQVQNGSISGEEFMSKVGQYLERKYQLSGDNKAYIEDKIIAAIFGNYILEDLLYDPDISDIKIIAYNNIRVKVKGQRRTSDQVFFSERDYNRFIYTLGMKFHIDINGKAIHVFTDTTSNPNYILRFNITTPVINSSGAPYLHIRKVPKIKYSLEDLIGFKMLDAETAQYLLDKTKNGKGIVFTGKGASGKTTLMNTLLDEIPHNRSGLIIQESEELFSDHHPDLMFQHIVTGENYSYSLQDEARNGLLTDIDYFVIGEIKGGEALYFLNAAATGHKCWCSVHSSNSKEAIRKLADYVMYESKYDQTQSTYMLKELETIVFMKDFKIQEISEIAGWDEEKQELIYKTIYPR